jgi:DNA-binding response OmpR family regulator
LQKAYELHPDLIILDVMMPGLDGYDVCSRLREMASMPVLMLTARNSDMDVLRGFNAGVDDYVKKPFNSKELEARVRALLRRVDSNTEAGAVNNTEYSDGNLEINLNAQTVKVQGKLLELSPREFGLLACLVREQGKVISKRELLREAWGEPYANGSSLVTLYIYYLRKKLEDGEYGYHYIHTLWGRGYWFAPRTSSS